MVVEQARSALRAIRSVILPPRCVCQERLAMNAPTESGLCPSCFETLELGESSRVGADHDPGSIQIHAPFAYGGPLASVIAAAKFDRRRESAKALGRLLASDRAAQQVARTCDTLVPIPLSPLRGWQRGFNQAEVIARQCARAWSRPLASRALRRVRDTIAQSELPRAQRDANMWDAFVATGALRGKVALIDDVVTSGATLHDAARALRQAGADEVVGLTVCQAE